MPSFFDLRFCSISQMPLVSLLSSPVAFFTSTILPLLAALLHSLLKGKSQRFLGFLVRYKVHLAAFHIELKVGGWQHFHSSLPSPHMELQAHLEPSPPTTTVCKPSTAKKKSKLAKINTQNSFRKRSFAKISTRKI